MKPDSDTRAWFLSILIPTISVGSAFTLAIAFGAGQPGTADTATEHAQAVQQANTLPVHPPPTGRAMFMQSCAHCHGPAAEGTGDGPDLHGLRISNACIATVIRHGIQ